MDLPSEQPTDNVIYDQAFTPYEAPPALPSTAHRIFLGPFGLRAGWSMAIFALLFAVLIALFSLIAQAATGNLKKMVEQKQAQDIAAHQGKKPTPPPAHKEEKPKGAAINEALAFLATAVATFVLALIERRRMRVYGIGRNALLDILPGALWGLVALSLLIFVLHALHLLVFDARLLSGPAIYLYGAKWLLVFLLVGLLEEYINRGFLQYTLTRGLVGLGRKLSPEHTRFAAFWLAATVMSILFGALHLGNPGETAPGIAMVFLAGMLFSYALWRTGSLWWAIGFHMTWDWAQSFLWGVPDSGGLSAGRLFQTHPTGSVLLSGGSDGPEGSLLVLPTLLLVAFIIRFTTQQRPQPELQARTSARSRDAGNRLAASVLQAR